MYTLQVFQLKFLFSKLVPDVEFVNIKRTHKVFDRVGVLVLNHQLINTTGNRWRLDIWGYSRNLLRLALYEFAKLLH